MKSPMKINTRCKLLLIQLHFHVLCSEATSSVSHHSLCNYRTFCRFRAHSAFAISLLVTQSVFYGLSVETADFRFLLLLVLSAIGGTLGCDFTTPGEKVDTACRNLDHAQTRVILLKNNNNNTKIRHLCNTVSRLLSLDLAVLIEAFVT